MKRIMFLGLMCGLLAFSAGCRLFCGPCGGGLCPAAACDRGPCADGCGSMGESDCGPGCWPRSRRPCLPPSGPKCGPACGPCGDPCCDPCQPQRGPLTWLFCLFTNDCWWGRTCGERYCGDWYNDPPDCSDPCDCCGNYTGGHVRGGYDGYSGYVEGAYAGVRPGTNAPRIVSQSDRTLGSATGSGSDRAVASRMVSQSDRVVAPAQRASQPHRVTRAGYVPRSKPAPATEE